MFPLTSSKRTVGEVGQDRKREKRERVGGDAVLLRELCSIPAGGTKRKKKSGGGRWACYDIERVTEEKEGKRKKWMNGLSFPFSIHSIPSYNYNTTGKRESIRRMREKKKRKKGGKEGRETTVMASLNSLTRNFPHEEKKEETDNMIATGKDRREKKDEPRLYSRIFHKTMFSRKKNTKETMREERREKKAVKRNSPTWPNYSPPSNSEKRKS